MTSRFRFISAHRAAFGVKRLCRVLAVSRSGFYRWAGSEPARQARAAAEDALAEQITRVHADPGGTYSPRVTIELHERGVRSTANGSSGSCGNATSSAGIYAAASAPPSRIRPSRPCRT